MTPHPWQERPDVYPIPPFDDGWHFRSAQDKAATILLATFLLGCATLIGFGWVIFEVIL